MLRLWYLKIPAKKKQIRRKNMEQKKECTNRTPSLDDDQSGHH